MSHFQNSAPQKRGDRTVFQGRSVRHVLALQSGPPAGDRLYQSGAVRATKRRRHAVIGDHHANGLVIQGAHAHEFNEGDNPDSATPPIDGDSLKRPDFPINFNGLGVLAFTSPVRIPTIDGTVNVSGDIYSKGTLLGAGGGGGPWTSFTPTLTDGTNPATMSQQLGQFFTVSADSGSNITFFTTFIQWTSKGSMSGNVEITFAGGFPTISGTQYGCQHIRFQQGLALTTVGSDVNVFYTGGGFKIYEDFVTTGAATAQVTDAELSAAGSLRLWGFIPTT